MEKKEQVLTQSEKDAMKNSLEEQAKAGDLANAKILYVTDNPAKKSAAKKTDKNA